MLWTCRHSREKGGGLPVIIFPAVQATAVPGVTRPRGQIDTRPASNIFPPIPLIPREQGDVPAEEIVTTSEAIGHWLSSLPTALHEMVVLERRFAHVSLECDESGDVKADNQSQAREQFEEGMNGRPAALTW